MTAFEEAQFAWAAADQPSFNEPEIRGDLGYCDVCRRLTNVNLYLHACENCCMTGYMI